MPAITSIIGLISIVDDLKIWYNLFNNIFTCLSNLLPQLADSLKFVAGAVHSILELARSLYRPIMDAIFSWLGIQVDAIFKDILMVFVFYFLGNERVDSVWGLKRRKLEEERRGRAKFLIESRGIPLNSHRDFEVFNLAMMAIKRKHEGKLPMLEFHNNYIERAKSTFGTKFDTFVRDNPDYWEQRDQSERLLDSNLGKIYFIENSVRSTVKLLSIFVLGMIIIEIVSNDRNEIFQDYCRRFWFFCA